MEQDNKQKQNEEIEIDLCELWDELKKNFRFIGGVTIAFVLVAAIYSFMIAKPVYEYVAFIRLPQGGSWNQANNFAEVMKSDVKPDKELKDPKNKLVKVELLKNTDVIKVVCEGQSEEKARSVGDEYIKRAINRINKVIVEQEKQKFSQEVITLITGNIDYIVRNLHQSTNSDVEVKLNHLIEQIETKEKNKLFIPADVAKEAEVAKNPIRPRKVQNIAIALVVGVFLSCGYVTTRYLLKMS